MNDNVPEIKLILLEGVPGSGKSTAGAHLQNIVEQSGMPVRFWREGDFDNPADFEGVACLTGGQYRNLLSHHLIWRGCSRNSLSFVVPTIYSNTASSSNCIQSRFHQN